MARAKKVEAPAAVHPLQRFEAQRVHRRDINPAPYNPRQMKPKGRAALRRGMTKHGLVNRLVWNKRTGTLVGGHQRLKELDKAQPGRDYLLDVDVIDVSETDEIEINVLLNNPEAQGLSDLEKLKALLRTPGVDPEATGFDASDVWRLFGDDRPAGSADDIKAAAAAFDDQREKYNAWVEAQSADRDDYYLVFVAKSPEQVDAFLSEFGLDDNRYHDLAMLRGMLRGELTEDDQPDQSQHANAGGQQAGDSDDDGRTSAPGNEGQAA